MSIENRPIPAEKAPYTVYFETGTRAGAETYATVSIELFGSLGRTGAHAVNPILRRENPLGIQFGYGMTNVAHMSLPHVGVIEQLRVSHDGTDRILAPWFLERVAVETPRDGRVDLGCQQWLDAARGTGALYLAPRHSPSITPFAPPAAPSEPPAGFADYELTIVTRSDNWTQLRFGSGTDGPVMVFATILGLDGATAPIDLTAAALRETGELGFTAGSVVALPLVARDVGAPTGLRIELKEGTNVTWLPQTFSLVHGPSGEKVEFGGDVWLEGSDVGRELLLTQSGPVPRLSDLGTARFAGFRGSVFDQIEMTAAERAIWERLDHFAQVGEKNQPITTPVPLARRFAASLGPSTNKSVFQSQVDKAALQWRSSPEFATIDAGAVNDLVVRLHELDTKRSDALDYLSRFEAFLVECRRQADAELQDARGLFGIKVEPQAAPGGSTPSRRST